MYKENLVPVKKLLTLALMLTGLTFAQQTGRVRVVHASPDAPAVDILVDGSMVIQGLPYREYTEYLPVPVGTREIRVNVTGTDTTVLRANPNVAANTDYTAVAVGFAGGRMPALDLLLTVDDNTLPAAPQIKLRAIHAAASAPSVDVYLTTPFEQIMNRQPGLANVPFKAVSPYITAMPMLYQLRVTPTGTKTVAINSGRLATWGLIIRTIIAVDAPGGGAPFDFLVLPDRN